MGELKYSAQSICWAYAPAIHEVMKRHGVNTNCSYEQAYAWSLSLRSINEEVQAEFKRIIDIGKEEWMKRLGERMAIMREQIRVLEEEFGNHE